MAFWDDSLLACIGNDNKWHALLAHIGSSNMSDNGHVLWHALDSKWLRPCLTTCMRKSFGHWQGVVVTLFKHEPMNMWAMMCDATLGHHYIGCRRGKNRNQLP